MIFGKALIPYSFFTHSKSHCDIIFMQKSQKALRQNPKKSTNHIFAQKKRQKIVQNGYLQIGGGSV